MSEALVNQVKRKLNITWNDEDTEARVSDIMGGATSTLLHRLGIADPNFDFSVAGDENTLYLNYCLYERDHCLSEFFINYAEMIASTRARHIVKQYEEAGDTANE